MRALALNAAVVGRLAPAALLERFEDGLRTLQTRSSRRGEKFLRGRQRVLVPLLRGLTQPTFRLSGALLCRSPRLRRKRPPNHPYNQHSAARYSFFCTCYTLHWHAFRAPPVRM